jgi:hypothetical protein
MVTVHVQDVIDWLVERELGLWQRAAADLNRRCQTSALHEAADGPAGGFVLHRRRLLERPRCAGRSGPSRLRSGGRGCAARGRRSRNRWPWSDLVEVCAIGLGLVLKALLTTAAADATGLLAASVLGVLRLAVIPWRRGIAERQFRSKMEALRRRLAATLEESFRSDLGRGLERLRQAMAPYRRFVFEEEDRLQRMAAGLDEVSGRLAVLEWALHEAAPAG